MQQFRAHILDYFAQHGRSFSWRQTDDPYHILVSEIMLQQTQTHRVEKKFDYFIAQFPDVHALSQAPLRELIATWQGLGYNRRALSLQKIAHSIVQEHNGMVPDDPELLVTFPGIGKATAASICAFAFNKPTVFIETNIRTVFIHFFFAQAVQVHDNDLYPLVQLALDTTNPRCWYYALMDYGVMLKKNLVNPSRKSVHHAKQSSFQGSDRQIRGKILKLLSGRESVTVAELFLHINDDGQRVKRIVQGLVREGFIRCHDGHVFIG